MKKKHKLVLAPLAVGLCAVSTQEALAQFDAFLKIDGIPGESQDSKHRGEIDVLAFHQGVAQPGGSLPNFKFSMAQNKSSPVLYACCAGASNLTTLTLVLRKAGGLNPAEFMKYTFQNATVTSIQSEAGVGSGTLPVDEFTINFQRVEWNYRPLNPDGSLGAAVITSWTNPTNKMLPP